MKDAHEGPDCTRDRTGGKSLYVDFRPPGAGAPQGMKPEVVGAGYRGMIGYVHDTLDSLKKRFPGYDGNHFGEGPLLHPAREKFR